MKFLMTVEMDESIQPAGGPPQPLADAMTEYINEEFASGRLIDTGGLAPTADGRKLRLSNGEISVTDGPFTETKEVIGGYALMELDSEEEAVSQCRKFVELHQKYWPGLEMACSVRQAFGPERP